VQYGDNKFDWGKSGRIVHDSSWRFVALGGDVATRDGTNVDEIARIDAQGRVTRIDQMRDVMDNTPARRPCTRSGSRTAATASCARSSRPTVTDPPPRSRCWRGSPRSRSPHAR
jgi:hypothetical protein